ncbi:MAG: hypothetical protein R3F17_04845 [Planctomycetota bacterium]
MSSADPLIPRSMHGRRKLLAAAERFAAMQLIALDIDGTLTDGQVVYLVEEDAQRYCVQDGQGLVWLRRLAGMKQAWISGRAGSPAPPGQGTRRGLPAAWGGTQGAGAAGRAGGTGHPAGTHDFHGG